MQKFLRPQVLQGDAIVDSLAAQARGDPDDVRSGLSPSAGTTAVFAAPLVYNTKRSGVFELGGRRFVLRRVAFPETPPPEWFVVDLLQHADQAGASRADISAALARSLSRRAFNAARLREMARRYGSRATQASVNSALKATQP